MPFHISRYNQWQAGEGTPVKYAFGCELDCDQTSVTDDTMNFRLYGTITVTNHPDNSRNSFAASDFALITFGTLNPTSYPMAQGGYYYQAGLPWMSTAPADALNKIIFEFRGDTYRDDGPNRVSLWVKGQGLVLNAANSESTWTFNIDTTFSVPIDGTPDQQIIAYTTTGAGGSTDYGWGPLYVWATRLDFDYRPGESWNDSNWMSHNRSGGACDYWDGSKWVEMRTIGYPSEKGNPPSLYRDGDWYNMAKIGQGG